MNKFFLAFSLIILIGAGCVDQTNVKTVEATPTVNLSAGADGNIEVTTVDGSRDVELVVETKSDTNADASVETNVTVEEDGVIDVTLGETVGQIIDMEAGNFFFKPSTITAKPGERIKIQFQKNSGFHTFVIDEINFEIPVTEGDNVIFTAPKTAGNYTFYCDIGSHKDMGMQGIFLVK